MKTTTTSTTSSTVRVRWACAAVLALAFGCGGAAGPAPPTVALKARVAAGAVTSPACAGGRAIPVAPADEVVGRSEDGSIGPPVGEVLGTSAGRMRRLDIREPRGVHWTRSRSGREVHPTPSFASNAVPEGVPWFLCKG